MFHDPVRKLGAGARRAYAPSVSDIRWRLLTGHHHQASVLLRESQTFGRPRQARVQWSLAVEPYD